MLTLTHDSKKSYTARFERGETLLRVAWGRGVVDDDAWAAAADAISDILTRMCGRAGQWADRDENGVRITKYNGGALTEARDLLEKAFESYKDDAEDYCVD